jgi:hypothetical protein
MTLIRTACVLAALAAAAAAPAALGGPDFHFETILADGMWNNPTSTAIDENGVIHVAYMTQFGTQSDTKEIFYARKAPDRGGGSWQFTQVTDNDVREELPCIALDQDGNVHIAFSSGVPGGTNMIRYVNTVGQAPGSFNPVVDITGNGFAWARVAVDSQGVAHFAFRTHTLTTTEEVMYRTYDPATQTLGPLVNISNSPAQDDFAADIAVDADDNVHYVWQRGGPFGGPLAYVTNASGSFVEVPTGVPGSVSDPKVLVEDSGRVTILYRPSIDALRSIEKMPGESFSASQPVYTDTYRSAFIERFAADANGHRYVAFASNIAANRGTFFVRETEDGWQVPLRLAGEGGGNQGTSVAINGAGELVVTWSISGFDGIVFADMFAATATIDLGAECIGDLNDDGAVDVLDLLLLLDAWGPCADPKDCDEDLNGDGNIDVLDLLLLLDAWGPCP